jgi:hypothetical protein
MWQEGDFHEAFIGFPLFHASSNAYNWQNLRMG